LRPSGLQFEVPKDWIDWYDQFGDNLHLTGKELDRVGPGAGEWDEEYARVCNAVLPFDRCAAHVGGEGWGKNAASFGDLQVRVYDLQEPVNKIQEGIAGQSLAKIGELIGGSKIGELIGGPVQVQQSEKDGWRRIVYSYGRFYHDYGAKAHVDIRIKQIGERPIAFVFMYTNYQSHERTIADMLLALESSKRDVGR